MSLQVTPARFQPQDMAHPGRTAGEQRQACGAGVRRRPRPQHPTMALLGLASKADVRHLRERPAVAAIGRLLETWPRPPSVGRAARRAAAAGPLWTEANGLGVAGDRPLLLSADRQGSRDGDPHLIAEPQLIDHRGLGVIGLYDSIESRTAPPGTALLPSRLASLPPWTATRSLAIVESRRFTRSSQRELNMMTEMLGDRGEEHSRDP